MAMMQTPSEIEARLQAFINSTPSQLSTPPSGDEPLIILHTRKNSDAPTPDSDPLLLHLTTRRSQISFQETGDLLHETLENRILFQTNIHYSNVSSCTLISCTISRGDFEACYFKGCKFVEKESFARERGNASKAHSIYNSHVENSSICDAEISGSTLKSINCLRNCELKDSLVVDSVAHESKFTTCGLHESNLHNCTVVEGVQTDSVVSTKTALRAFPAEIRKMIFGEVLEEEDDAVLNMMAAFRPDSLLYGEILEACFRGHTFVLSNENLEALKSTPTAVRRRITKIRLKGPKIIPTKNVARLFPTGTRITDITLEFYGLEHEYHNAQALYNVFWLWFKYLMTVKTLTVVWTDVEGRRDRRYGLQAPSYTALNGAIRTGNQWMKNQAVCVEGKKDMHETMTWTWTADEDEVLAWHSCLIEHQSSGCPH